MQPVLYTVLGAVLGGAVAYFYRLSVENKNRQDKDSILADAHKEADHLRREAKISMDEELSATKKELEEDYSNKERELHEQHQHLEELQDKYDGKLEKIEKKRLELDAMDERLQKFQHELSDRDNDIKHKIEELDTKIQEVSGLSHDEARDQLFAELDKELEEDFARRVETSKRHAEQMVQAKSRELLLTTMQRFAGECVSDRTTATIFLPGDEIKGRIIGRDGRNIRTIETLTGANVIIDDTPETVVVSCFNPFRRELCKQSLERLVEDGRIHPNRIHEVITEVRESLEKDIIDSASFLCNDLAIRTFPEEVMAKLGRLKYRFDNSQNLLQRSKEVAAFMGLMAGELKLDIKLAQSIGLLHAIGLSFDEHSDEDSFTQGAAFLEKYEVDSKIVKAIQAQTKEYVEHNEYAQMLQIAIHLSVHRPGAQNESMEFYIKRLEQMEYIAKGFDGVFDCQIMQAGREMMVYVHPKKISDAKMKTLAHDIAQKLDKELDFPGPIHIVVRRETKADATIE